MIKLLIFDLDGTLIDSAQDIVTTTNAVLTSRGEIPLREESIVASIGEGPRKLIFDFFPQVHADPFLMREINQDFDRLYEQNMLLTTKVFYGVEDFLDSWTGKIAIATNKPGKFAHKMIEGLPLARYPWVRVIAGDTLTEKKPHPLPLQEIMKEAGVEPHETLMIGDGVPDMVSARRAGVHSVACEFGYTKLALLQAHDVSLTLPSYDKLDSVIKRAEALEPRAPSEI